MWDPEVVILTAPRIPEEEFKFQKKSPLKTADSKSQLKLTKTFNNSLEDATL